MVTPRAGDHGKKVTCRVENNRMVNSPLAVRETVIQLNVQCESREDHYQSMPEKGLQRIDRSYLLISLQKFLFKIDPRQGSFLHSIPVLDTSFSRIFFLSPRKCFILNFVNLLTLITMFTPVSSPVGRKIGNSSQAGGQGCRSTLQTFLICEHNLKIFLTLDQRSEVSNFSLLSFTPHSKLF